VPCYVGGMARPQVVDGGDGLQIWRVATNILTKQSQTAEKGVVLQTFRRGVTTHIKLNR
jgi:hypothetical protein